MAQANNALAAQDKIVDTITKRLRDGVYDETFAQEGECFKINDNIHIDAIQNGEILERRMIMNKDGVDHTFRGKYVRRLYKACMTKANPSAASTARGKVHLDESAVAELMDLI